MTDLETTLLHTGPSSRSLSEIAEANLCLQRWAWKYGLGVGADSRAPALGTLVHVGQAHLYGRQAGADLFPPEAAIDRHVAEKMADGDSLWGDLKNQATEIQAAYEKHYLFDRFKVLMVETEVSMEFYGKVWREDHWEDRKAVRTKRIDLAFEAGNRVFLCDHKSAFEVATDRKVTGYAADMAFHYMHLYGSLRWKAAFGGVYINFIGTQKPYTFKRVLVPPQPGQIAQLGQSIIDTEDRLAQLKESGRDLTQYPRVQHEQVCQGRYGRCPFYDRCHG